MNPIMFASLSLKLALVFGGINGVVAGVIRVAYCVLRKNHETRITFQTKIQLLCGFSNI
jgi:hypothetical protein